MQHRSRSNSRDGHRTTHDTREGSSRLNSVFQRAKTVESTKICHRWILAAVFKLEGNPFLPPPIILLFFPTELKKKTPHSRDTHNQFSTTWQLYSQMTESPTESDSEIFEPMSMHLKPPPTYDHTGAQFEGPIPFRRLHSRYLISFCGLCWTGKRDFDIQKAHCYD